MKSRAEQPVTDEMKANREERIVVVVTGIEKRKFEKVAKERYMTISELVRQLLHREADTKAA